MDVSWLVEKRIILVVADEQLSLTDFAQANQEIIAYLDNSNPSTHIIANFADVLSLPSTIQSLHKILTFVNHPNLGWEMFITDIGFVKFLVHTINRIIGRRSFHLVKTYQEAKERLQELDPTLPDLPDSI